MTGREKPAKQTWECLYLGNRNLPALGWLLIWALQDVISGHGGGWWHSTVAVAKGEGEGPVSHGKP